MVYHLGEDYLINDADIIGVFDLDTTTFSKKTREYLARAEKERRLITLSDALPKSFVVCRGYDGERVYLTGLSAATLKKRITE